MKTSRLILNGALLLIVVLVSQSIFVVKETERAILKRFGEIVQYDVQPGLHFKIPVVNEVSKFDARILTLDAAPQSYLTSEKKALTVDSFVKWRISGPENFFRASKGDERIGLNRLSQIINDLTKSEFSKRTINDVVSGDRTEIMNLVKELQQSLEKLKYR